jgi:N-methylhydantoinase A
MASEPRGARLGIDVGGTFVDLAVEREDGALFTEKILSRPTDLVAAIHEGLTSLLDAAALEGRHIVDVVHATTLGSNAVLERRGPAVGLLTTRGFGDVLQIQRSLRYSMYDVQIEKRRPLVPRSRVFEITERCRADGTVVTPLVEEEVAAVARELRARGVAAVAVSYLHAYVAPEHERRTREILAAEAPDLLVTLSSDVSLQGREYERTNTAATNAYLAPVLSAYLLALGRSLPRLGVSAPLWITQSSGGLIPAERAATTPVRTIESGPAAGALMAASHGRLAGHENVISLDMGGTTAKAAVIRDGRPATTRSFELERVGLRRGSGLPLDIPAIDLIEIGAGGGSIAEARVGVLQVGPRSAGADPGPACYGRGGGEPTVTDANLLLGYLDPDYFAGGAFPLDPHAAERAVDGLAAALGLDRRRAAWGIHEVVTLEMERAVRLISIDRGLDPRDFALVCIGGAGPAHGCRLARALGVRRVIVPPAAGVGSALGLLEANESLELARTALLRLDEPTAAERAGAIFAELEEEARSVVEDAWGAGLSVRRAAGLRYAGQGYELEVGLDGAAGDVDALAAAFHSDYERTYGYREDRAVEAVTWYLTLFREAGRERRAQAPATTRTGAARTSERPAFFPESGVAAVPILDRGALAPGDEVDGPALVGEAHTTTVVPPDAVLRVDDGGALVIDVGTADGP